MSTIKVTKETPTKIITSITNLVHQNKLFSDITDSLFMIKLNPEDKDEDALVSKTLSSGITLNIDDQTIEIQLVKEDYKNLRVGVDYLMCFSVEFSDDGNYIEDEDFYLKNRLRVHQDKTRK